MSAIEMVERVARAILDAVDAELQVERDIEEESDWSRWIPEAKAAIEAMREPTKAVAIAASGRGFDNASDELAAVSYGAELWRQAIDAALEEDA